MDASRRRASRTAHPGPLRRSALGLGIASVLLTGTLPAPAAGQAEAVRRVVSELEPEIRRAMAEGQIPSASFALVVGEEVVWARGFGHANLWSRTPATARHVYYIASTLKPMTTAALLQQMEEGKLDLDDPVSEYLGEGILIGEDPDRPVTFRHLLTHTSGLPSGGGGTSVWENEAVPTLADHVGAGIAVEGPPLEEIRYSNPAFGVVGRLVEILSGDPFDAYLRERIWEPLGMTSTRVTPDPDMHERMVVPYVLHGDTGRPVPAELRRRSAAWPAGSAFSTVEDMGRWLAAILNGGALGDVRILEEETVDRMLTRQYDGFTGPMSAGWGNETAGYGLGWWTAEVRGERHLAHSGSMTGFTNFVSGNRDRRTGFVALTTGQRQHAALIRLSDLAHELMEAHLF